MMVSRIIEEIAASRGISLGEASELCATSGVSLRNTLGFLSLDITRRYLAKEITFEYADSVMNGLSHSIIMDSVDIESEFAWAVFLAFDAGEYIHKDDTMDTNLEDKYTIPLLHEALEKFGKENAQK